MRIPPLRGELKSEERVKGGFEKAIGRVKKAAGALVGDEHLKTEGKVDQAKGGGRQGFDGETAP